MMGFDNFGVEYSGSATIVLAIWLVGWLVSWLVSVCNVRF
jgi:cell division protein FtsX